MPKKLTLNSLSAEIDETDKLLKSAKLAGDLIGELQLTHRVNELRKRLSELSLSSIADNSASVALYFGGAPVLGSKGIASSFAGLALEQFQNIVAKVFAKHEIGQLGDRGRVAFRPCSELMITGVARGSFGFVLDEMSDQAELDESQLSKVIDEVAHTLSDVSSPDDAVFYSLIENLDPRTLMAVKDFFANLDSNHATLRLVEKDFELAMDASAVHRGRTRTEATQIEEEAVELEGTLVGFLPDHKKFEIKDNEGRIIYGSATPTSVEQFENQVIKPLSKRCLVALSVKTVSPLNRPSRQVYRLLEFLKFL